MINKFVGLVRIVGMWFDNGLMVRWGNWWEESLLVDLFF